MQKKVLIGRILCGIVLAFLTMDAVTHLMKIQPVIEAFQKLSIPENLSVPLGLMMLGCLFVYAFRSTRILAAVLITGYLGGAVAIHARAGSTAFEIVFPILIGGVLWAGLYLTDERVRFMMSAI